MNTTTLTQLNEQMLKDARNGDTASVFAALTVGADPMYENGEDMPVSTAFALHGDIESFFKVARLNPAALQQKTRLGTAAATMMITKGLDNVLAMAAISPQTLELPADIKVFGKPINIAEFMAMNVSAEKLIFLGKLNPKIRTKRVLDMFARGRNVRDGDLDELIAAGFTN